jgi:hypothetical protein
MRGCTGRHANQTSRQAGTKRQHLTAPQPLARYLPARFMNAVDLNNALGQIPPNRRTLAHGGLPLRVTFDGHHFGTREGAIPPISLKPSALLLVKLAELCT